jgi:hypothetical protein
MSSSDGLIAVYIEGQTNGSDVQDEWNSGRFPAAVTDNPTTPNLHQRIRHKHGINTIINTMMLSAIPTLIVTRRVDTAVRYSTGNGVSSVCMRTVTALLEPPYLMHASHEKYQLIAISLV